MCCYKQDVSQSLLSGVSAWSCVVHGVLDCTLEELCIKAAQAYLLNILIFTVSRNIGISTHLHIYIPEFFPLLLRSFWTIRFPTVKENHSCHGAPSTFTLLFTVKDAARPETCGRAHGYNCCQPQAVPGGARAEQPPHSTSLRWQGQSPAATERSRRFRCYHLIRFCSKQLSGQNRRRPLLRLCLVNVNAVTPAIEHTRSVLCGIIYLGTVSNYSRSILIFAILMV